MKKDLQSLYKKYIEIKSPQGQNMADGGKVEGEDSTFQQLADAFKKAFNKPQPAPTPDPSQEEKYDKIRKQNRANFDDPSNQKLAEGGIVGLEKVSQYADGGEAEPSPSPQSQEERDAESEEITRLEDQRKLEKEEESKPLNKMAKGGEVEHDKHNLLELKAAFDKFLGEESKEKMSMGGLAAAPAYNYSEGGNVLDANARKHIAAKNFAGPDRSYPINDAAHARNALSRVSQFGSPELKAKVRAKVHSKYPSIGMDDGGEVKEKNVYDKMNDEPLPITNPNEKHMGNYFDSEAEDPVSTLVSQGLPKYDNGGRVGMGDVKAAERKDTMPSLSESLGEMFQYNKTHPEPSPNPKNYADGGLAAPNNGKLPYMIPHNQIQLYKKYLALNQPNPMPHYDDGGQVDPDTANIPNYQSRFQSLQTVRPDLTPDEVKQMIISSNAAQPSGNPAPAWAGSGSTSPSTQGTLAQNVTDQLNQMQPSQPGMADGGSVVEPDKFVDTQTPEEEAKAAEDVDNTGYAPEDYAAQQAADESTQGQIENELASEEPADMNEDQIDIVDKKADEPKEDSEDETEDTDELGNGTDRKTASDESAAVQQLLDSQQSEKNDLQKAQKERDQEIAQQEIAKGGALLGAGIAGRSGARVDPSQALNVIAQGDKYVNLPVQKYEEQLANQQNDPNSPASKAMQQYMASKGFKVPPNASYADMIKIAPFMAKDAGLQNALQKVLLQQGGANQRADAKNVLTEKRNAIMKQEADARTQANKLAKDQAQENKDNADFEKMGKLTTAEVASSRSPFGKAANVARSADQIEAIGKQYADTNQLDNRQVAEIARSLDSMLSNGAATVTGAAHLLPKTASGNLASIEEYIAGIPEGAEQKEFVDRMMDTVKRERSVANSQMVKTQGKLLAPFTHLKTKYPERYNQFLKDAGIPAADDIPVDADLTKLNPDQLKKYIELHGGQQ